MGNKAFVVFKESKTEKPDHGVYLHWNGGPESILGFLEVLKERKWTRMDYASARFVAVVSEMFDGEGNDSGLSVGIMGCTDPKELDPGDNGIFEVLSISPISVLHQGKKIVNPDTHKTENIVQALRKLRALRTKNEQDM